MREGGFAAGAPLLLALLAGCLGAQPLQPGSVLRPSAIEEILASVPLVVDHDHGDAALHRGSFRVEQVAYAPLNDDGGDWIYGEIDVAGDRAAIATVSPKGGFLLLDIAQPEAPRVLGRYVAATTYAADVKLTEDGRFAVLGSQFLANQDQWMPPMHLPPADPGSVGINGFQLVSLEDPAEPRFVAFLPVEQRGVHMLDLHVIGGATYAFGAPGTGGHVAIARLAEGPLGAALVPWGKYVFPPTQGLGPAIGPHDVTVYDDPELGKPILLVAAGLEGIHVVDVSEPSRPALLGAWRGNEGQYVHTVMPAFVEGKRLIVATPERFTSDEQLPLWIIDASDLGAMATLTAWRLPGERLAYDGDYRFSTHNINVRDGVVYLAHYHAGFWALDISTLAKAIEPQVLGAFLPSERGNFGVGLLLGLEAAPLVWDAVPLPGGRVLLSDIPTGLYVVTDPAAGP